MSSDAWQGSQETRVDPYAEPEAAREALRAVTSSERFAKAERLKSFLTYVVEEAIAGRAETILGKTIAQDVYGRGSADSEKADNLVRVDARRLRRKLDEYYNAEGAQDAIRIVISQGGYTPAFIRLREAPATDLPKARPTTASRPLNIALSVGAVMAVLIVLGAYLGLKPNQMTQDARLLVVEAEPPDSLRRSERDALLLKSAASVQARNLCDQARGFLFPIADIGGQKLAIDTFTKAIEIDPELSCGYAGAAHAMATLSILSDQSPEQDELLQQSLALSRTAIERAPTDGWSQSSAAWAAYASGETDEAVRLSLGARRLSPNDGNVLDFLATISILAGNFDTALKASDPEVKRDLGSYRFASRNLRAVALFHSGEYDLAIRSLEDAIRNGDPVSALTLTFLIAANQSGGKAEEAQQLARELATTWPNARPDIALIRLYSTPALAQQVLRPLSEAGWKGVSR